MGENMKTITNSKLSILLVGALLMPLVSSANQHDTAKMPMQHQKMNQMNQKHTGQGGGGHGSLVEGLGDFPTSAYAGSPLARPIEEVMLPGMAGDPEKGKMIAYNRNVGRCLNCHILGADGDQAGTVGPNLSDFGNLGRSDEYIFQQLWDARAHNPQTVMPPMGTNGLLKKHQIVQILAYLKTLKTPITFAQQKSKDRFNLLVANRDFTLADEYIVEGEALFNQAGKNGKSCASCHQENDRSLAGVAASYPKIDAQNKIVSLEERTNICRKTKMDSHQYKLGSPESNKISSYLKFLSRDEVISVATREIEQNALERGKVSFYKKTGQLNLSCADCHVQASDKWLAGQYLNSFAANGSHRSTAATWPRHFIARHDLGLISLQQRIRHCQVVTRTFPQKLGSAEYTEMELYLTSLANDAPLLAPTKSNLAVE